MYLYSSDIRVIFTYIYFFYFYVLWTDKLPFILTIIHTKMLDLKWLQSNNLFNCSALALRRHPLFILLPFLDYPSSDSNFLIKYGSLAVRALIVYLHRWFSNRKCFCFWVLFINMYSYNLPCCNVNVFTKSMSEN